jgi:ABC-2 type transport system ATP-binding protein
MSIVVFVVLTVSVLVAAGPGLALDKWLAALPGLHTKNSVLAKLLAVIGQRAYSAPVLLVVAVLLAWRRRIWRPITLALIGLLSLNVIVGAMKLIIARPSPRTGNWLPFAGGTDFPSGHTSNTVLTWGLVAWLLLAFSRPVPTLTRQRIAYGLVAVASVVVGGASLYLRTHWISDIVAGWAVGFLILVGVTRLQNVATWRARLDRIEGLAGVVRRFDHRVSIEALRGVSFSVEPGELFGLLGPERRGQDDDDQDADHAAPADRGSARVLGHDVVADAREVRRRIGYVFGGDRGLYERLSALDNLRYFAELYGVPGARAEAADRVELLELVGLNRPREASGSRATRAACGSGCTSPAGCCTTPRSCSSTSRRIGIDPVGARELRAPIAGLRRQPARRSCSPRTTCSRPTSCATGSRSSPTAHRGDGHAGRAQAWRRRRNVLEVEVFGAAEPRSHRARVARRHGRSVEDADQAQLLVVPAEPGVEVTRPCSACLAGDTPARPGRHPRADPRGRLRRAGRRRREGDHVKP